MRGTRLLVGSFFVFLAAACGPSSSGGPGGGGADGADAGGPAGACQPGQAVCQGDEVHQCNADGTMGGVVTTCDPGTCFAGTCGGGGGDGNCQTAGNDLVYVVDVDYNLLSFDPQKLPGDPFQVIGHLDCPAGAPYPDADPDNTGVATPFSMSVDRNGSAWVLYSSGEIFKVSITDASCSPTTFQTGQHGFDLFGMGFVSDAAGSNAETLYIAGGSAGAQDQVGDLGDVAPDTMTVSSIGGLPSAEYSPELTGTANGDLYAYFPGQFDSFVAQINKSSAKADQKWDVDTLGLSTPEAWAFAHWGGKFYIFITSNNGISSVSKVHEFDPMTGNETTVINSSQYEVVGAGVSTCAPVVVD